MQKAPHSGAQGEQQWATWKIVKGYIYNFFFSSARCWKEPISYLHNEKVAEVPSWQKSVLTKLANLLLIVLYSSVQCVTYAFNNFELNLIPYWCISSMELNFATSASTSMKALLKDCIYSLDIWIQQTLRYWMGFSMYICFFSATESLWHRNTFPVF